MTQSEAQTWHHGVVARWWAEFNLDGPEIDFFRRFVEAAQPALDVACGTGRLLVPYLHAGFDVDGCDVSPDMLALCRERAEREGLPSPRLYAQAVHELELPRRYRTIVFCGGFGLGGSRDHDIEGLHRLHAHLEPGGTLVLDNEVPYADAHMWPRWTREGRADLPRPWREPGDRRRGSDGTEYALRTRLVALDPLSQHATLEMRAWMWRGGELVAEEEHVLEMALYFTHELRLLLEQAGFVDVELRAGYEDRPPTRDDDFVVFVARTPASR
jgi:SAM-dependent methyltransferase